MSRVSKAAGCMSALLLLSACGGNSSTTTTPTTPTTTDTFTGTLSQGGTVVNTFTVTAVSGGTVTFTLVALTPQSTITVGLGLGSPSTTGCTLSSTQENVKVGTALSTTLTGGTYCVALYDLGNLTATNNYTLTVLHP